MGAPPRKLGYGDIQTATRQAAQAALKAGKKPAAAARAAIDRAESLLPVVIEQVGLHDVMARIECGAGCSSCCHQMVGVSPAELALVRRALAALPKPVRAGVMARAAEIAVQGRGLDQAGWWQAKLRCPLLDDGGRCLVHAARPLPCRAMNSSSAAICQQSFVGTAPQIPIAAAPYKLYGHAQAGLIEALAQAGLPYLPTALGVALAGDETPLG